MLDVEDICDIQKPDERSVMTYVAEYFHAFSNLGKTTLSFLMYLCSLLVLTTPYDVIDKVETAGRRVAQFAEVMASVWEMQNDYERRVLAVSEKTDAYKMVHSTIECRPYIPFHR